MNEEDDVILNKVNKISNDNDITNQERNNNNLNDFIADKEKEIKDVLLMKLNFLENELAKYKQYNSEISSLNLDLKKTNENNLKIIKEQEKDLNSYEYKFNNLNNDIKEKDIEIFELKNQIKKLENKLKEENEEKSKNEEYNKYKINKIKMQYNEEIKLLNSKNEKSNQNKK
jgi:uncharacterized coiled-coil protein SlyX